MNELKRIVEQAHMAGQYSAGVDPSYSEARSYCSGLEFPNIDELKAHIERLINALSEVHSSLIKDVYTQHPLREAMERTLTETPSQSLSHIRAQVEEETINRCRIVLREYGTALYIEEYLEGMQRKYKEQSD